MEIKKKFYELPRIEIVSFKSEDIIITSVIDDELPLDEEVALE